MDRSTIAFFVFTSCLLLIATGLNALRREYALKRREHRMTQALRQGLQLTEGLAEARRVRVIQWPACETNSAR